MSGTDQELARGLGFLETYPIGPGTMIGAATDQVTYETEAVVAEDTEQTIVEAAAEYNTVCGGATRSSAVSEGVFGSLPERVGADVDRTVVMARDPEESPMSIHEAIMRRLEV